MKEGDLYFDVGANDGNRIQPIMDAGIKIIAIEPQKECIKYLKSKFGDKITIIPKGLGEKEEIKIFNVSTINVLSSFSEEWIERTQNSGRYGDAQWFKKEEVEITTLDKLIEEFGIPRFIKIDVEGYELEVLNGLSKSIDTISYEYTVPEQTDRALMCLKRIIEINGENIRCNYSIGESMEWALKEWISPDEMIREIHSQAFINSGFGDIYVSSC
ncbi:MAG: FkbM family methyltransferase [Bacteroidales bacterium]